MGLYRGYVGIMEKNMETMILYRVIMGYTGSGLGV